MLGVVEIRVYDNGSWSSKKHNEFKHEFITAINEVKKYYSKSSVTYLLDGSVKAVFDEGLNAKDMEVNFSPIKQK